MKIASIRLEDNNRTSLAKMLCPGFPSASRKLSFRSFSIANGEIAVSLSGYSTSNFEGSAYDERLAAYATGILDFYHAVQYLWKGAAAWLDGRTTPARRGFGWARHRLRHGQPDGVLADLAEALEIEGLPDTARDTVMALYAYLDRHRDHIDYAKYKELGLPIGSGMVESACKWLIQQRFKGVGMRWSEDGFNHLLHLRLAWVNGSFEALLQVQLQPSPNT